MKNTGLPFLLFDALLLLFVIVVDKGVHMQNCIERCGHGTICKSSPCGNPTCPRCVCRKGFKDLTTAYNNNSTTVTAYCKAMCDGSGSSCPLNTSCLISKSICTCSLGFTRSSSGVCIKSCGTNEICPENTSCQRVNGVPMCECSLGFIRSTSGQCVVPENDCGGQCGNGTMCNRTTGECSCMEGYTQRRKQNDGIHTVYYCTENDCGGQCGHGTECNRKTGNCSCTNGFHDRRQLVDSIHTVYYCTAVCEQGESACPPNTTCSLEYPYNQTSPQHRCQCSPGFKISYPGLCLGDGSDVLTEKPGTNNPSEPTAQRNRDPESNEMTFALAVGIGGGLLVILVVSVVVVVLLRRKSSNNNKRDASGQSPHNENSAITTTAATRTTNFNLPFEDENKFQTNISYVPCKLNTSVGVGENLAPSCNPGSVNGGALTGYEEIDLPFLSNRTITHPVSITGDKEHVSNAEISTENFGAAENRQGQVVYDTIPESRGTGVPSKTDLPELYSNHKIPYTKEVQKAQRKQSVEEMSSSNYNTLYYLTVKQSNGKNDEVQPEVTEPAIENSDAVEKRQGQVVYNTIPESPGTGVPSKTDLQDFYSNHKIPYTKELQKAQRKQSVDDMSSNNYNTLYYLTVKQSNGKNDDQREVAQADNHFVVYNTVPQNTGDTKPALGTQHQNEVEYDRLKLPTV